MVDGERPFNADKAYKDSKLCNLLMALQIHQQRPDIPVVAWSPGLVIPRTSEGFFRNSRQAKSTWAGLVWVGRSGSLAIDGKR